MDPLPFLSVLLFMYTHVTRSLKIFLYTLAGISALFVIVLIAQVYLNLTQGGKSLPSTSNAPKFSLFQKSKIPFPTVVSETVGTLPENLHFLNISEAKDISIKRVTYQGNKLGYHLDLNLDFPLISVLASYNRMFRDNEGSILFAAYDTGSGLVDAALAGYQVEIRILAQGDRHSSISVQVIENGNE